VPIPLNVNAIGIYFPCSATIAALTASIGDSISGTRPPHPRQINIFHP
jgi:hypothetical protein